MQRDVRRTARTLLTRAGVPSEIAERVVAEKHDALTRLAALIERIVNPPPNNVVPLRSGEGAA
jgi:hypothetical protein